MLFSTSLCKSVWSIFSDDTGPVYAASRRVVISWRNTLLSVSSLRDTTFDRLLKYWSSPRASLVAWLPVNRPPTHVWVYAADKLKISLILRQQKQTSLAWATNNDRQPARAWDVPALRLLRAAGSVHWTSNKSERAHLPHDRREQTAGI